MKQDAKHGIQVMASAITYTPKRIPRVQSHQIKTDHYYSQRDYVPTLKASNLTQHLLIPSLISIPPFRPAFSPPLTSTNSPPSSPPAAAPARHPPAASRPCHPTAPPCRPTRARPRWR